jgi:hypothetical protein
MADFEREEDEFEAEFANLPGDHEDLARIRLETLMMNLKLFGEGLEVKAEQQERLRKPIEDRWISDIRQHKGL